MNTCIVNGTIPAVKHTKEAEDDEHSGVTMDPTSNRHESSDDCYPPPKKRRRSRGPTEYSKSSGSGATKVKGKQAVKLYRGRNVGKLAKLLQMPVDIFCEIAAYLEPLDLLQLARSSKSFNHMLMSRDSKPIWRVARRYYGNIPDCPTDLSEPAYARLLFEKVCHACLAPRALKVYYLSRVRLCHRCRSSNIVRGGRLLKSVPGLTKEILECLSRGKHHYDNSSSQYFYVPQVEALVSKFYSAVPQDIPQQEAKVLQEEFYDRHKQLTKELMQHAEDIKGWERSDSREKRCQSFHASLRREASLRTKLMELGHKERDLPHKWEDSEWRNIIVQPRDLTPLIWAKVRSKLEACIQRVKLVRAKENRRIYWDARNRELSAYIDSVIIERANRDKQLIMTPQSVFLLPSVVALLEGMDYEQEITQAKWDAAWGQIEMDMDEFADHARRHLIGLISPSLLIPDYPGQGPSSLVLDSSSTTLAAEGEIDSNPHMAALYSARFQCNLCLRTPLLKYPALLDHHHSFKEMMFDATSTRYAKLLLSPFIGQYNEEELCALGPRLQCLRCDSDATTRCMDWSRLIEHFVGEQEWFDDELLGQTRDFSLKGALHNDHALDGRSPAFAVLDDHTAHALGQRWAKLTEYELPCWTCALCRWSQRKGRTNREVRSHIRRNHLKDPGCGDIKIQSFSHVHNF